MKKSIIVAIVCIAIVGALGSAFYIHEKKNRISAEDASIDCVEPIKQNENDIDLGYAPPGTDTLIVDDENELDIITPDGEQISREQLSVEPTGSEQIKDESNNQKVENDISRANDISRENEITKYDTVNKNPSVTDATDATPSEASGKTDNNSGASNNQAGTEQNKSEIPDSQSGTLDNKSIELPYIPAKESK